MPLRRGPQHRRARDAASAGDTPCSSTFSTLTSVMTFTPSFLSRFVTPRDNDSAKVGRTRLPASSRTMLAFDGSMRWNSPAA